MKNFLVVCLMIAVSAAVLLLSRPAHGGERPVCKIWLDDGGIVARSTAPTPGSLIGVRPDTAGLGYATLDGVACPANRLQSDGGIVAWDAGVGFEMTQANGQPTDGGVAGCPICDFRGASSVVLQCKDPVYYSEQWDGGYDKWNQRGVIPATTDHVLVDFDANPDGYRIDFRSGAMGKNQHLSIKPVTASATNSCTVSIISRSTP